MVASNYPLLNAFWTMLWFFGFVIWIWVLVGIITDIFRSADLSGWAKGLWLVLVIFLPVLGVLSYLIARGGKMHEHAEEAAEAQDAAIRGYVRDAAGNGGSGPTSELERLAGLRDRGALTQEEFEAQKSRVLATPA
jgi:hypothetical protein